MSHFVNVQAVPLTDIVDVEAVPFSDIVNVQARALTDIVDIEIPDFPLEGGQLDFSEARNGLWWFLVIS